MAFSETRASRTVLSGVGAVDILLSETVYAGDCLGISGGTWVLSAHTLTEHPLLVAGVDGVSGETIEAYLMAVVELTISGATTIGEVISLDDNGVLVEDTALYPDVGFTISATQAVLFPSIQQLDTPRT